MSDDTVAKLAALGSQTEEHLAFVEEAGRADVMLTALAVSILVLSRVPQRGDGSDLKAMKLLFHELAGDDSEIWQGCAEYLVDGTNGD